MFSYCPKVFSCSCSKIISFFKQSGFNNRSIEKRLYFLTLGIVAFGSPAFSPFLSIFAASLGYGIFWRFLAEKKHKFLWAASWYFIISLIQLDWMTAITYQGIYMLFVYGIICLLLGVQFGLFSCLIKGTLSGLAICSLGALWTIGEWARLFCMCGFSFAPVGLALTSYPSALQMASLFGMLGLSFFVIVTNLCFFARKPIFYVLALFPYVFGIVHIAWHQDALSKSCTHKVLLVQPGLVPEKKSPLQGRIDSFIPPIDQWEAVLSAFSAVKENPALIVFPESAFPFGHDVPIASFAQAKEMILRYFPDNFFIDHNGLWITHQFFAQFLAENYDADVVIGLDHEAVGVAHASAFCFSPYAKEPLRYDKKILLPLAEYLPFSWLKQWTARYGIAAFFTPGNRAQVLHGKKTYAVSICYEETFSHLVREGRKLGAEMLINITNDGWYFPSRLPWQHFFLGRVRTVENGTPLVRACNTGVTSCIDALGRTISVLNGDQGILISNVPTYQYKTFYSVWGNAGILLICFGVGILQLFMLAQKLVRQIDFCR